MANSTSQMRWVRIARIFHRGVAEVVARRAAVISAVILLLYLKLRKQLSWHSKKGRLPVFNSQYLGHPVHPAHPQRPRRALQVLTGLLAHPNMMIKVVNPSSHCQTHPVYILEREIVVLVMQGVKAWLSVLAETPLQDVVLGAFSSPCRPTTLDLSPLDISLTSNVEGAKTAMGGRPQETSMATGDSKVIIISPRYKTSNNLHLSEISRNPRIPLPTVFSLATDFEDP